MRAPDLLLIGRAVERVLLSFRGLGSPPKTRTMHWREDMSLLDSGSGLSIAFSESPLKRFVFRFRNFFLLKISFHFHGWKNELEPHSHLDVVDFMEPLTWLALGGFCLFIQNASIYWPARAERKDKQATRSYVWKPRGKSSRAFGRCSISP